MTQNDPIFRLKNNKQQKKVLRKEQLDKQLERQQQELDRLKTIIQFQDILARFDSTVRQDFVKGTNGAIVGFTRFSLLN